MDSNCKPTIYYGVYVPSSNDILDDNEVSCRNVFFDKLEALKEVKKNKKARFKAFQFYHEAEEFAKHGSEYPNNNSASTFEIESNKSESSVTSNIGEKPSQFRGPKSQDLVRLRKAIEAGDLQFVETTIWENPRYLISNGDTPAILQEGARYNALHVAAKAKNAEMCDLILTTVGSPEFLQLLYGEENRVNCENSAKILLDLYLNTPDKSLNETPLHFAVKFGAANVVEILTSYPQCDKTVLNKYGDQPKDMICSRCTDVIPELKNRIATFLDERFYVPVLRSEDNCVQAIIGEPFCPINPLELNTNPLSPRLEIHAYAGPMKKEEASVFRKKWKTPPRSTSMHNLTPVKDVCNNSLLNTPVTQSSSSSRLRSLQTTPSNRSLPNSEFDYRLFDTDKGLERIGRDLAKKFNVGWKEYWPFLGTFTDLTTADGLDNLETYLDERYKNVYTDKQFNIIYKHFLKETPSNTSDHVISSKSLQLLPPPPTLNNSNTNIHTEKDTENVSSSPMSELCKNMEACTLNDNDDVNVDDVNTIEQYKNKQMIELQPKRMTTLFAKDTSKKNSAFDCFTKAETTPCLCIEKSCQVLANRITHQIIFQMDSAASTTHTVDIFESEIKHLKLLINNFMVDSKYLNVVNFQSVHSRIAYLIVHKLKITLSDDDIREKIVQLETIINKYDKIVDLFSSDDEDNLLQSQQLQQPQSLPLLSAGNNNNKSLLQKRKSTSDSKQVICLIQHILKYLENIGDTLNDCDTFIQTNTEQECLRAWANAVPCLCVWKPNKNHHFNHHHHHHRTHRNNFTKKNNQLNSTNSNNSGSSSSNNNSGNSNNNNSISNNKRYTFTNNKWNLGNGNGGGFENVARKLHFFNNEGDNNNHLNTTNDINNLLTKSSSSSASTSSSSSTTSASTSTSSSSESESQSTSSSSSSSRYQTANTSPSNTSEFNSDFEDDEDGKYENAKEDDINVFIEGNIPTRIDYAVYNAIKNIDITPEKYPNIYRWRHHVNLYPEEERLSWSSPNVIRFQTTANVNRSMSATSTPRHDLKRNIIAGCILPGGNSNGNSSGGTGGVSMICSSACSTSSGGVPSITTPQWLRVTGPNSPGQFKAAHKENIVTNMFSSTQSLPTFLIAPPPPAPPPTASSSTSSLFNNIHANSNNSPNNKNNSEQSHNFAVF